MDVSWIFAQHFPKIGPDLTDGTPYTTNLHVFLRPWVRSMNIIKSKMNLIKKKLKTPTTCKGGLPTPLLLRLVGGVRRNLTKFWGSSLKVVPRPSEAFLVSFWTDEKP